LAADWRAWPAHGVPRAAFLSAQAQRAGEIEKRGSQRERERESGWLYEWAIRGSAKLRLAK